MNKDSIKISVILPVYNGEKYLRESIESILSQSISDFEFIIINDGSTDKSSKIVHSFSDLRIRYYEQSNIGLAATLNRGIDIASGKYIARQDQDDISLPERFEKQLELFESHPELAMVGTWAEIFNNIETGKRFHEHPTENFELQFALLFNNPFVHSSMMIRTNIFDKVGEYSTDLQRQPPEDYELWSRIAKVAKVANVGEVLIRYREVLTGMSHDKKNPFEDKIFKIACENNLHFLKGEKSSLIEDIVYLMQGSSSQRKLTSSLSQLIKTMEKIIQVICNGDKIKEDKLKINIEILRHHYINKLYINKIPLWIRKNILVRVIRKIIIYIHGRKS